MPSQWRFKAPRLKTGRYPVLEVEMENEVAVMAKYDMEIDYASTMIACTTI